MDLKVIALIFAFSVTADAVERPHIILIVADDLGWNDISYHGSNQIPTPNIDCLAKDGIILNKYYVHPICSPSRSALMTGVYPIRSGMQHNVIMAPEPFGLPLKYKLLPEHLKDLGYRRHIVGKWHLGFFQKNYTPTFRGFESHFGYWVGHQDYYDHTSEEYQYWGYDMRSDMNVSWDSFGKYTTELFSQRALDVIDNHDLDESLFLYLPHLAVHSANSYSPLQAPAKYKSRFPWIKDENRRTFAGMLAALDDSIGLVIEKLQQKRMLNDSVIIFTTDNGGPAAGFDLNYASNWPLRGVKATLWEGGIRGSAFVWSRFLNKTSRVSTQLMKIEDWLPTIYSAAGGDVKDLGDIDGVDMWSILSQNKNSPQKEILHNIDDISKVAAIRSGDFKLVQGTKYGEKWNGWYGPSGRDNLTSPSDEYILRLMKNSKTGVALNSIKRNHWSKFNSKPAGVECSGRPNATNCHAQSKPCLFDISKDPCEYHNLAAYYPELVKILLQKIEAYRKKAMAPGNKKTDPRANPILNGGVWNNWMD